MGVSRSQITIAVNNDKTGYSLTAGSYVTRATSSQRATQAFTFTQVNLALPIASVSSLNQTSYSFNQRTAATTDITASMFTANLTSTSAFDVVRGAHGSVAAVAAVEVWENFV